MSEYPPKPDTTSFQHPAGGFRQAEIVRWEWSVTFNRWGAVVVFEDSQQFYTWPKTY